MEIDIARTNRDRLVLRKPGDEYFLQGLQFLFLGVGVALLLALGGYAELRAALVGDSRDWSPLYLIGAIFVPFLLIAVVCIAKALRGGDVLTLNRRMDCLLYNGRIIGRFADVQGVRINQYETADTIRYRLVLDRSRESDITLEESPASYELEHLQREVQRFLEEDTASEESRGRSLPGVLAK